MIRTPGRLPPEMASTNGDGEEEEPPQSTSAQVVEPYVVPIEESIDLHHFVPSEVLAVVDAYLDAALAAGFREVRLIHGRGKGVQRANIRRFMEGDSRVERFRESSPDRGGWGATVAWLRNPHD